MPNHYQNIMIFHGYDAVQFDAAAFAKEHHKTNWCEVVKPVFGPKPTATCQDQEEAWGIKWGTYRTQAMSLEGDGDPVIIAFCTPWRSPELEVLKMIGEHICKMCGFTGFSAVAFDPYDNSLDANLDMRAASEKPGDAKE